MHFLQNKLCLRSFWHFSFASFPVTQIKTVVLHGRGYINLFAHLSLKETPWHLNGRKEVFQLETHKNQQVSGEHFHFDETTPFTRKLFHLQIGFILVNSQRYLWIAAKHKPIKNAHARVMTTTWFWSFTWTDGWLAAHIQETPGSHQWKQSIILKDMEETPHIWQALQHSSTQTAAVGLGWWAALVQTAVHCRRTC